MLRERASAPVTELPRQFYELPPAFTREAAIIAALLTAHFRERRRQATAEALLILSNEKALASSLEHYPAPIQQAVDAARKRLEAAGMDWRSAAIEARYASVTAIQKVVTENRREPETFSDKLDRIVTHKVWGMLIFVAVMALMFLSIFSFAQLPDGCCCRTALDWLGGLVGRVHAARGFASLLVDGVIAGVGAVVAFLPQICLLFLFIGLLEDTGYMARAAFLMDRLMSKVGLHGKSFIPDAQFLCLRDPGHHGHAHHRNAQGPAGDDPGGAVDELLGAAAGLHAADRRVHPGSACWDSEALTMLSMYLLGIVVALGMAWLFKKTLLKGETPMLVMELPPYKPPAVRRSSCGTCGTARNCFCTGRAR